MKSKTLLIIVLFSSIFLLAACKIESKIIGIEIDELPTKLEYEVGDTLLIDGLSVKAIFDSGDNAYLSYSIDLNITPEILNEVGDNILITVEYKGFTDTFTVIVYEKKIDNKNVSITVYDGQTIYYEFETPKDNRINWFNSLYFGHFSKFGYEYDGLYLDSEFINEVKDGTILPVYKLGYIFIGWHIDKEMTTIWDLSTNEDRNIYGYWIEDIENHDTHPHYFTGYPLGGCGICNTIKNWILANGREMSYHDNPFHNAELCEYCISKKEIL